MTLYFGAAGQRPLHRPTRLVSQVVLVRRGGKYHVFHVSWGCHLCATAVDRETFLQVDLSIPEKTDFTSHSGLVPGYLPIADLPGLAWHKVGTDPQ